MNSAVQFKSNHISRALACIVNCMGCIKIRSLLFFKIFIMSCSLYADIPPVVHVSYEVPDRMMCASRADCGVSHPGRRKPGMEANNSHRHIVFMNLYLEIFTFYEEIGMREEFVIKPARQEEVSAKLSDFYSDVDFEVKNVDKPESLIQRLAYFKTLNRQKVLDFILIIDTTNRYEAKIFECKGRAVVNIEKEDCAGEIHTFNSNQIYRRFLPVDLSECSVGRCPNLNVEIRNNVYKLLGR